jgi:hypothetical protein
MDDQDNSIVSQVIFRSHTITSTLDRYFSSERKITSNGKEYTIQYIVQLHSQLNVFEHEVRSYVQGMVNNQQARWLCQTRTLSEALIAQITNQPPTSVPTTFRLI